MVSAVLGPGTGLAGPLLLQRRLPSLHQLWPQVLGMPPSCALNLQGSVPLFLRTPCLQSVFPSVALPEQEPPIYAPPPKALTLLPKVFPDSKPAHCCLTQVYPRGLRAMAPSHALSLEAPPCMPWVCRVLFLPLTMPH